MKKMTCKQLGGACDYEIFGETFEEMAEKSKAHGMEMAQKGDADHLKAMEDMKEKMVNPNELQQWMEQKRKEFDAL